MIREAKALLKAKVLQLSSHETYRDMQTWGHAETVNAKLLQLCTSEIPSDYIGLISQFQSVKWIIFPTKEGPEKTHIEETPHF